MSVVSICNKALSRAGVRSKIDDIDEDSQEAVECKTFYDEVRDEILAAAPWPFAVKYVALANSAESLTEWGYEYIYPSDCLKAIKIVLPDNRTPRANQKIPFTLAQKADGTGRAILTDQDDAVLCYISRVTDTTQYGVLLESAISWKLAAEIAMPLSSDASLSDRAEAKYMQAVNMAFASAMNEKQHDEMPDSELYEARIS